MIAGRYEPLDEGLARDSELDRVVRIRWIESRDEVDDPRLSDPAVVRVYDIGEHEGRRFAAIEHVDGLPLSLRAPLAVAWMMTPRRRRTRPLRDRGALSRTFSYKLGRTEVRRSSMLKRPVMESCLVKQRRARWQWRLVAS